MSREPVKVAVLYRRDGYDTSHARLLGRQAAGEGFLRALVRYGRVNPIVCATRSRAEFEDFCQLVRPWFAGERQFHWIDTCSLAALGTCGTLFRPDVLLTEEAFRRRCVTAGSRAYSITGVTHTIATRAALRAISDLLLAPFESWDALICTSQAVKTAVDRVLANWGEYLAARLGGKPVAPIRLPVIPLGVHCDLFPQGEARQTARQRMRALLSVGERDLVALYVGRLTFYAKAHPAPMYLALERVAQSTGARIHLVHAGWFEDEQEANAFRAAASALAPSIRCHFIDGRNSDVRRNIWPAGDLFLSLSDNFQETFGIAPIEAMANGLPVVVSDWNGYRESVRHELDGFRVPTVVPGGGTGADWASGYLTDDLGYGHYVGYCSMSTAVDVEACTAAVRSLVEHSDLRHRLGANGRQRARETYDWSVVLHAYEELWAELAEARQSAPALSPPIADASPPVPLLDDPFRQFAHYATEVLGQETCVALGGMAMESATLGSLLCVRLGASGRAGEPSIRDLLDQLRANGPIPARELFMAHPEIPEPVLARTLLHLAKFDLIRLHPAPWRASEVG